MLWWLEGVELLVMFAGMAAFGAGVALGFGLGIRALVVPSLSVGWVIAGAAVSAAASPVVLPKFGDWFGEKAFTVVSLLALPFLLPACVFHTLLQWCERQTWPRSLQAAVDQLVADLDAESLQRLREKPEEELAELHFGLGMGIRNGFGLWAGNRELLAECGTDDADVASGVILGRLWQQVRTPQPPGG
jgi:MFS family permease